MCKVFPYNDMLKDGPTCLTRHLVSQLESKKTQAREHELASFSLWVKYPRFLLSIYFISYLLRFHDKADELFFFATFTHFAIQVRVRVSFIKICLL